MNEFLAPVTNAGHAITVDDLKRKAVHIKDMTEAEARSLAEERVTEIILVGVVAVVAVVSIAYYLGTRRR